MVLGLAAAAAGLCRATLLPRNNAQGMGSEYSLADVIRLFRHADMAASYKPALLAAIVRCIKSGKAVDDRIDLESLGAEYLSMYWSQVVIYRLRHSPRDRNPPIIVREIQRVAASCKARLLADLAPDDRLPLIRRITSVLPINVLAAFHVSKPERMPPLFEWAKGDKDILVSARAQEFIRTNSTALSLIANYFLARFLSKLNTAPHIVEKTERLVPKRAPLNRFSQHFRSLGERHCFYCGADLDAQMAVVDHFIPWTFVFEDRFWNLVLACVKCNSSKSDHLPTDEMLEQLLRLNSIREAAETTPKISRTGIVEPAAELKRLYELAREEQWPLWQS